VGCLEILTLLYNHDPVCCTTISKNKRTPLHTAGEFTKWSELNVMFPSTICVFGILSVLKTHSMLILNAYHELRKLDKLFAHQAIWCQVTMNNSFISFHKLFSLFDVSIFPP